MKRQTSVAVAAGLLLTLGGLVVSVGRVAAGPITNGLGNAPFTRLGVYQGVVSVAVTPGGSVMELGYLGRHIAGSGDLFLRPRGVPQAQGAKFTKLGSSGYTDLLVDSLCLSGTGTEVCRSSWPSGGSGDPYWRTVTLNGATYLSPIDAPAQTPKYGVRIGSVSAPINGRALDIYANNPSGPAAAITGDIGTGHFNTASGLYEGGKNIRIVGALQVQLSGNLQVNVPDSGAPGSPVWDAGTDGISSVLDADTFDGTTSLTSVPAGFKDLFWKTVPFSPTSQLNYLCINTTHQQLCAGGANVGNVCSSDAQCPGSFCKSLCYGRQRICTASGSQKRCATNNAPCTNSSQCPVGDICTHGDHIYVTAASTSGAGANCAAACQGRVKCTGATATTCSGFNRNASFDSGAIVGPSGSSFVCPLAVPPGGTTPVPTCACDCTLSTDTPYFDAIPNQGGDLCTQAFL